MNTPSSIQEQNTLFGHPTGLFTLFFAEMWERFSYYGMRALLTFYMIKGFLGYGDSEAYTIYGAYTALVYMTPLFGGMIADRLLGQRKAVVLGGALMASGHLFMGFENETVFFIALALLILGNGFFKPNISTIVGSLYPQGSPKRDAGFTLFYIGINLGAAMAPLLCGFVGETYGWHYGFGLATVGMLIGLAVFVLPRILTQALILGGALVAATALFYFHADDLASTVINYFVGMALLAAGGIAVAALQKGGLPEDAGLPPDPERLREPAFGRGISAEKAVYLGTLVLVPVFALLVCGLKPITGSSLTIIPGWVIETLHETGKVGAVAGVFLEEMSSPAGLILVLAGVGALLFIIREMGELKKIARERLYVVLVMTFFSLLFWAIFEQAGSSVNLFTDRNVDRVNQERVVDSEEVGKTIELQLTQEQLGYTIGGSVMTLDRLDALRNKAKEEGGEGADRVSLKVTSDHVGMGIAKEKDETKASIYQSLNPAYILILGLVFTALWGFLGARGFEPSTPVKFSLGLAQLGLGFGCFWIGAAGWMGLGGADDRGMVAVSWLYLGYLLQTTGELCLSPVGLSMVTKLSPARLVSTVMGMWFLATAFSAFLSAIIAQFTGIGEGGEGGGAIPVPSETVNTYGDVFGLLAIIGLASGTFCLVLSPMLKRWMHEGEDDEDGGGDEPTGEDPGDEGETETAKVEAPAEEEPPASQKQEDELPPAPEGSGSEA
ncbi:MAG: oligopeptide:H+ symporter [Planctomycetota bacterium]|nr:oligopeptide:H+ symporter [Planctomycetota bacterium]